MLQAKYIIFDGDFPHLFHPMFDHSTIAKAFPDRKPTSAGFCRKKIGGTGLMCYGESMSLKLGCKDDDELMINTLFDFTVTAS